MVFIVTSERLLDKSRVGTDLRFVQQQPRVTQSWTYNTTTYDGVTINLRSI